MRKCNNILLGFLVFFLLCGQYILPEKTKIITILSFVMIIINLFIRKRFLLINKNQIILWIAFWVLGCVISILSLSIISQEAIEFGISIVIGLSLGGIYASQDKRNIMLKAIFAVCVVTVLGCFLQLFVPGLLLKINRITLGEEKYYYFLDFFSYRALTGFSFQTGITGYYLAVMEGFILTYILGQKKKRIYNIMAIVAFVVVYIFILLTMKRSQLLAVMLLSLFFFCIYNKKHAVKAIVASIILLAAGYLLLFHTATGQAIIVKSLGDNPLSGRDVIYRILFGNFLNNPIFGNGFGYTLRTVEHFRNGHNIYLQVLSENGIIGFLLYFGLIYFYLKQALKLFFSCLRKKTNSTASALCLYIELLFVLNGFFGNPLYDVYPLIIFLIVSGIVKSSILDNKKKKVGVI